MMGITKDLCGFFVNGGIFKGSVKLEVTMATEETKNPNG